jgi:hypothetical protein
MKTKERKFTIGRAGDCDIVLADETVSRHHAVLWILDGGNLFLTDNDSRNGTFLLQSNGQRRIRQELISSADTLLLGSMKKSVKDLLVAIRAKFPCGLGAPSESGAVAQVERARGKERRVRCGHCGAIKKIGSPCPECNL